MIRCEPATGTDQVKVTFTVPLDGLVGPVAVVGDFNDWDPTATLLDGGNGMCRASVVMGAGRRYAFRYLAEGGRWFNDQTADDYQPNEFGGSDSVVDLTGSAGTADPSATRRGPQRARIGIASDTGELTMR